jgi:hypothetical protein
MASRDYVIRMPPDRWIRAACEQVGCQQWQYGWETHTDEATGLGQAQAAYIRRHSGRTFTEHRTAAGLTVFRFAPHQRCFAEHRTRPQRFLVRDSGIREHTSLAALAEDYTEHTGRLAEQARKG